MPVSKAVSMFLHFPQVLGLHRASASAYRLAVAFGAISGYAPLQQRRKPIQGWHGQGHQGMAQAAKPAVPERSAKRPLVLRPEMQARVDVLEAELQEAQVRETATAEILQVIIPRRAILRRCSTRPRKGRNQRRRETGSRRGSA